MGKKQKKGQAVSFIVGLIIFIIFIFPLYWMVVTALKTQVEIFEIPTPLWPRNLTFDAFKAQLSASGDTLRGFKNSAIIAIGSTIISTLLSIPAAYGLARFRFRAKKAFILFFLITQMLPSTLVLTSLYIMFSKIGLLNTYWAPILADATLGIPFSIIILRTYFLSIPKELDEAAFIDGCKPWKVFAVVVAPLMKPIIATNVVFICMNIWNDMMIPLYLVTRPEMTPVSLSVYQFYGSYFRDWNLVFADLVIASVPVILLYFYLQKYIISGLTVGAVKG